MPSSGSQFPFSPDYYCARDRFREAAASKKDCLLSLPISAIGSSDSPLTIDVAWFGSRNPKRVFIHSSGVHGVEGFTGSAIQLKWMQTGLPPIPDDSAIGIVHIVNPFGMVWLRRFNENNVDLNRNFLADGQFVSTPPPHWDSIDAFLNPKTAERRDGFYLRAAWLLLLHGMPAMRQAIAGGQRLNPRGLFFGGHALEEGPSKLQDLLRERLARAERIVAVDVHTGLGKYGEDRLLMDSEINSPEVLHNLRRAFGDRLEPLHSQGIAFSVRGSQQDLYFRNFPQSQVHFIAQEFGTYHPVRVLGALRAENRWHLYADPAIDREQKIRAATKRDLLEAFNPKDPAWRELVVKRGQEVIQQGLRLAFETGDKVGPA